MEKVYQLLVHGRRFSLGTLASSTIKTGCHDIAEILLKVVLSTINQINQSNSVCSLKQQPMDRHVTLLRHIILILSQSVFVLTL
jgi:hypothetical protein